MVRVKGFEPPASSASPPRHGSRQICLHKPSQTDFTTAPLEPSSFFCHRQRTMILPQSGAHARLPSSRITRVRIPRGQQKSRPKGRLFRCGPSEGIRTPGILLPNLCLNLQTGLLRPLWRFPALLRFLFGTLLPCSFQAPLSSFGIYVG